MDLPDPKDIPAHIAAGLNKVIEERSGSVPEGGGQPPIPMTAAQILDEAEQGGGAVGGDHNGPIVLIMVGMAGTGKTTLTQRITAECMRRKAPPYVINLDPACNDPPYPVNIDIRESINYKEVMKHYELGPNGAIVTALNLYATKFNEVVNLIQEKKKSHRYVIIDTPGQIEVFMWSASGSIITDYLAAHFPTVLIYVTDLVTNQNPITFISNMTYACSILYKTKLPLVIALNKRDLADPTYAKNWITDFDVYEEALREREDYASNLASSLALGMEEFYNQIDHVVVSAMDGFGMDDFFFSVQKAVTDYETVYRPMYEELLAERTANKEKKKTQQMDRLRRDLVEEGEDEEIREGSSCFVRKAPDAGVGLSLRVHGADDDDTSSSDEEDAPPREGDDDELLGEMVQRRVHLDHNTSQN